VGDHIGGYFAQPIVGRSIGPGTEPDTAQRSHLALA
jgi:hypothetical protein